MKLREIVSPAREIERFPCNCGSLPLNAGDLTCMECFMHSQLRLSGHLRLRHTSVSSRHQQTLPSQISCRLGESPEDSLGKWLQISHELISIIEIEQFPVIFHNSNAHRSDESTKISDDLDGLELVVYILLVMTL